jgi:glyoxylase-like metal-dependent hydrolase (beta-lactamase superfamily II)
MQAFICTTCGTQYPPSEAPPPACPICQDERQYVNLLGQAWTSLSAMRRTHFNAFRQHEPTLIGIGTVPAFAIAQRALLVRTPGGNILWDCVSFIDEATIEIVRALGGIAGIAVSHPHYYSSMIEWSHAFGGAPIHQHVHDRQWVMRPDPVVQFWDGPSKQLLPGLTLLHCPGHFAGAQVLHWAAGAGGKGALLTGDTLQVVGPDKTISFMWSFPNLIPLDANTVRRVADAVEPWPFESIYGAWPEALIKTGGKQILARSVNRYIEAVTQPPPRERGEAVTQPPAGQRGELESAAAQSSAPTYRWRHSG